MNPYTQHRILYEDNSIIVIHKPSGVLSHPNVKGQPAAYEGPYDPDQRIFQTPAGPLWLIHRLDQEASGILLAAKTPESAKVCRSAFENKEVEKNYVVLVARKPLPPQGRWSDFLAEKKRAGGIKAFVTKGPSPNALLHYTTKDFFPRTNLALIEVRLITGKTHQIRVQAAYHGHSVAGDRIYGNFAVNKELKHHLGLNRIFLHAWRIKIRHPLNSKILDIETSLPDELEKALERAR